MPAPTTREIATAASFGWEVAPSWSAVGPWRRSASHAYRDLERAAAIFGFPKIGFTLTTPPPKDVADDAGGRVLAVCHQRRGRDDLYAACVVRSEEPKS